MTKRELPKKILLVASKSAIDEFKVLEKVCKKDQELLKDIYKILDPVDPKIRQRIVEALKGELKSGAVKKGEDA